MTTRFRLDRGFTLTDIMITVAIFSTLAAISVPLATDFTADIKLNEAARTVERELQYGRLRAVSANRILRVRMNCPGAGSLRTVEYLNSSADTATNRCSLAAYPYPAADNDVVTRPNYDGPVRTLPTEASVGAHIIEFQPDGTAKAVVSNVAATITTPITITVTRKTRTRTITVNGAGKIQYQ
jgi:prepilin-type N-terminal cleavage/methylation domain-containing protein